MTGKNSNWICGLMIFLLWLLNSKVNSGIVQKPVYIEVKVSDSTILKCSVPHHSAKISWYHYPVGRGNEDLEYIYTDGQIFASYTKRFRIGKDSSTGELHLVITQVEVEDAGRYVCQNNGDSATTELIVMESSPVCMTNINPRGLVGPNSCGLEKETIQLSCGVNYKGNVPPYLEWTRIKQDGSSSSFPGTYAVSKDRITCNSTVDANFEMNESYFNCQTSRSTSTQYNCITETVKIPYLIENKTRIAKSVGDTVTCPAKVKSFDCSYKWVWYDFEYQETVSESRTLTIDREGLHRCEANCNIKGFKCIISMMTIKATNVAIAPNTSTFGITGSILGVLSLTYCCAILATLLWHVRKKKTRKVDAKNIDIEDVKTEISLVRGVKKTYY